MSPLDLSSSRSPERDPALHYVWDKLLTSHASCTKIQQHIRQRFIAAIKINIIAC